MSLFVSGNVDPSVIANYGFTAILILMSYGVATWDWAAEIRWMINQGILEYYIASGSGFLPHYLGLLPMSLTWLLLAMSINYVLLTILFKPPLITIYDPVILLFGLLILLVVLLGYAMFLGGTMITSGTTGAIIELISFILPIATGGLAPLSRLPEPLRIFALYTPFSYPAEIISYSILGWKPVLDLKLMIMIGALYSTIFMALGILYFRYQLRRILREGFRATAMW